MDIKLTEEQINLIKKDEEDEVIILTKNEIEEIAKKINESINIPFVEEEKEQIVIEKVVKKLDIIMYKTLPDEIYEMVHRDIDGSEDMEELEQVKVRTKKVINKSINIPFLSETLEGKIIEIFLDIIFFAMEKGNSILNGETIKKGDALDEFLDEVGDDLNKDNFKELFKDHLEYKLHRLWLKKF